MQKISETLKFVIIGAIVLVASMVAFFLGYLYRKKIAEKTIKSAEQEAQRIVEEAKNRLRHTKGGNTPCQRRDTQSKERI